MITNRELNEVTLSPTKKDYYQIWNELMELADKISERWSPASTNESDPGIVLLKALTAVADKLNYNIDKNTLEAFMPSATQEDSMRKLTEMMGYDMKHYQSATTKAVISYKSSNETPIKDFGEGIYFPKFVNLKNEDEDVNYVTLEEFTLQEGADSREVAIIEGEVIECETNNDNIITALQLDDLNRYILPEYAIAENGIFITNISDTATNSESELWRKEQNLNVQQLGDKVYKFGFDSTSKLPYIQFPEDIRTLIEDGIKIRYIRTNGLSGNISAKVLSKLEKPAIWATAEENNPVRNLGADSFAVTNNSAASNGANPETLNAAYNNYKKTIGTFDTLVTCRDYMNKIYQMTESDIDTTPLVSNIIVSDIRDDINKSMPICTFNEYGICYKDASLKEPIIITTTVRDDSGNYHTGTVETTQNKIEHFDLIFYPFKTIYGLNTKAEYKNSFKYTAENLQKIKTDLNLNKTIAHNVVQPVVGRDDSEIACIKNYLRLKARITTTKKVTFIEESEILNNIYKNIYANFNARQVDFGEEIPYETLLSVIKSSDYRIKEVNLDEPNLSTKFCLTDNTEIQLSNHVNTSEQGNKIYNKLALRNVLAGKISAFEYNNDFISEYDKSSYPDASFAQSYPEKSESWQPTIKIKSIESHFDVATAYSLRDTAAEPNGLVLKENEVIQFRLPNFKTVRTYPAYVNYFIKLNPKTNDISAIPATLKNLRQYMSEGEGDNKNWNVFVNTSAVSPKVELLTANANEATFKSAIATKIVLFKKESDKYVAITDYDSEVSEYYWLKIDDSIFNIFNTWIRAQKGNHKTPEDEQKNLEGIYRTTGIQSNPYGRLIDAALYKYLPAYKFGTVADNKESLENFFVQETREEDDPAVGTADGLGRDANYAGVPKDGEYQLKPGEYLLINYTDSKTDEAGNETKNVINKEYSEGTIIRANFNLVDSSLYSNNHSYSKRDGFNFSNKSSIEGMFTLGVNEQIEIRDIVKVELKESPTYLYWTLNSEDQELVFNENYGTGTNNAYTLKEGEHLYYTTSKKQDLVFYGAGTLIVKDIGTPRFIKYESLGEVSEEDIMTNGLAASIPWQAYNLSGNRKLEIIENQYISLTEGDTIISIDNTDPTTAIGNDWIKVNSGAEYRFAEDEQSTPLPAVVINGINWTVRSRLDFNMSKTTAQPLNRGDKLIVEFNDDTNVILESKEISNVFVPMYINSNYIIQAAVDSITISNSEEENNLDLKIKISSKNTPKISDHEDLSLDNYINGQTKYTKFNFENLHTSSIAAPEFEEWVLWPENEDKTEQDYSIWINTQYNAWKDQKERFAFSLNTNIPKDSFGLMMFYYIKDTNETEDTGAYIKAIGKNSTIEFFNCDDVAADIKYLKAGINILKVSKEVTQIELYSDINKKSTVIFGNLDLIRNINPKLDYRIIDATSGKTKLEQLLDDIKSLGIAEEFYYNIPIQGSNDIDLNAAVETDLLSSPLAWYDPNNANRKFVISEIDADYLPTGITLTKASRI